MLGEHLRAAAPARPPRAPSRSRRCPAASPTRRRSRRSGAPSDSTWSRTAGRTSNASTTAPSRRQVAIACKPGDTGAEDQRARRGDRSGRGHHQREDARQPERGHHCGVVAGERRHRREDVHVLRAADAGHRLEPEGGDALVDERSNAAPGSPAGSRTPTRIDSALELPTNPRRAGGRRRRCPRRRGAPSRSATTSAPTSLYAASVIPAAVPAPA